jgi:transcriptional regulator with XRE-family HTH domain
MLSPRPHKTKFKAPPKNAPDWAVRLGWALERSPYDKKEIAEKLGVVPKTIDSWTDGRTEPSYIKLIHLCAISQVGVEWVLTGGGRPPV